MSHTCHAHACKKFVPPAMFMCRPHWFQLPANLRDAIWKHYRRGQELDKKPTRSYLAVSNYCIGFFV